MLSCDPPPPREGPEGSASLCPALRFFPPTQRSSCLARPVTTSCLHGHQQARQGGSRPVGSHAHGQAYFPAHRSALSPGSPSSGKNLEEFLRPRQAAPGAGGWGLWREGATCRPASWALAVAQCGTRAWSFPPGLRESGVLEGKQGPPEANGWQGRPLSPVPPRSARPATSLISLEP